MTIAAWNGQNALWRSFDPTQEALRVLLESTTSPPAAKGRTPVTTSRKDYSAGSVTTGAWVQLVASLSNDVNEIQIFDSSGQTMELGVGGSGSEARQILIFPGGNGPVPIFIPSGSRVSVRAVSATAAVGELSINYLK